MLINRSKIRAAPIERATKKVYTFFRCPVYSGLPFRASVLIFAFVAEKTGLCGREDLFFWSSPILGVHERIHKLFKGTDEQKVWETLL